MVAKRGIRVCAGDVPVTGWRVDGPGEDGQIVIRSQFQMVF